MLYVTTRQLPTKRRQYEVGDLVDTTTLTDDELAGAVRSGSVVPCRFLGTAAELAARNPLVGPGQTAYETDTGVLKIGTDGATRYNSLSQVGTNTYGPILRMALGNKCVFLGNSITLGADSGTINQNWGDGWTTYASLMSGGRIRKVRNAGVSGDTSAQMLARFDTDVTPYAPNVVFLQEVTNDSGNTVPLATSAANFRALVAKCTAIRAVPVLVTGTPVGSAVAPAGTRQRDVARLNAWLTRYAADNGIHLIDFYSLLVDSSTGGYQAAYDSGDHIHPSPAGYAAMGSLVATAAASIFPAWTPSLPGFNTEPENGPANALFLLDTNSDGIPNSWTGTGGASGFTHSIVTDAAVVGSMAKIAQSANASLRYLYSGGVAGTYTAGDTVAFGGVVTSDGGVSVTLKIEYFTAGSVSISSNTVVITQPVTRGVWWMELVAPATTSIIAVSLIAAAGTGNAQWGRIAVKNLTTNGVLAA